MAYEFTRKTDNIDDVMAADVNELQAALEAHEFLTLKAAAELTIASGVITAVQAAHKLQPESSTADDLVTINGMDEGDILVLYVSDAGTDTITIKHGTGNISCVGGDDIALSEGAVICYFDGTTVFVSGGGTVSPQLCNGRLTLESGVPISTSNQADKTNLYFTPYNGNEISLYNGTNWIRHTFTELTLAIGALTASKPHDIFIYNNSGTLTLSATEWTNATTRATALTRQDGVYVKSGATNYRYLGTIYIDSGQKCQDTTATRYVWNLYNQKQKPLIAYDLTNNWVYTTATWRAANNNTTAGAGRFNFVLGLPTLIFARVQWIFQSNTANVATAGGICLDNTNSTSTVLKVLSISQVANVKNNGINYYEDFIAVGFHYLQRTEYSAATGTTTWFGDNGNVSAWLSGMTGLFIG